MLNGETPVEGNYRDQVMDELRKDEDGYDSDDSVTNTHESVRRGAWVLVGTQLTMILVHV